MLLDAPQHGDAVHVWQLVVEQHEVNVFMNPLERLRAVLGLEHVITIGGQPLGQRPSDQLFVVNDENRRVPHRHSSV